MNKEFVTITDGMCFTIQRDETTLLVLTTRITYAIYEIRMFE